jgi:hypothetical protein
LKSGKNKKPTPRQKVADILIEAGFAIDENDFRITRGGSHKKFHDILECWSITAGKDGRDWEITSPHTLTECAKGFRLESNTEETCLYGDLIARINPIPPGNNLPDAIQSTHSP